MLEEAPERADPSPDLVVLPAALTAIPEQQTKDVRGFAYDVGIVGLGYVGLPTALAFTGAGGQALGLDVSAARIAAILGGNVDLLPTDHARLGQAIDSGALRLSNAADAIADAACVIICVPTPVDAHLVPDLQALSSACADVVSNVRRGQVVILTSTTYVGTTRDLLVRPLEARGLVVGEDVFVAFSPERIDPGNADFSQEVVPRVVGGVTDTCADRAVEALSKYATRIHRVSSPEAAEMTKLFENTFRAVNISLVNEIADLSHDLGIDVMEVIDAASTKPYGFMRFLPGPGVGGHCIPCDPHYLLWQLKKKRRSAPLVEQAMSSIASRPRQVVDRAERFLASVGQPLLGARVVVVGVTYKPGVADCRESPALEILERFTQAGAVVGYYDPLVPVLRLPDGSTLASATTDAADLVVLHTLHSTVDYSWAASQPLVLDTTYRFVEAPHRAVL